MACLPPATSPVKQFPILFRWWLTLADSISKLTLESQFQNFQPIIIQSMHFFLYIEILYTYTRYRLFIESDILLNLNRQVDNLRNLQQKVKNKKERKFQEIYHKKNFFWLSMDIPSPNGISILSNPSRFFGFIKISLIRIIWKFGSDSIGFRLGLLNLQRTGTIRCTFGFRTQSVFQFKCTWFVSIL